MTLDWRSRVPGQLRALPRRASFAAVGGSAIPAPPYAFCQQLKGSAGQERCLQDVDAYFMMSVNSSKVCGGIVYMPPWREVLSVQDTWAVGSFIENHPPVAPRLKTSVDAAH